MLLESWEVQEYQNYPLKTAYPLRWGRQDHFEGTISPHYQSNGTEIQEHVALL